MVFKSGYFSCSWTYSLFAPKPSIVPQTSAHDSCQQKSQRLLNTSPPHVMSSVILYRVETSRNAGWDNGGELEVTVPYACTMTRQWRHRGQVTVHLLPVWQLFLEVYRNQERWLLMSQPIPLSSYLFPSVLVHSHPLRADVALQLCGRKLTQTVVFYGSRSGDRHCNDELPATKCINSKFLALLNYCVWSPGGLQSKKETVIIYEITMYTKTISAENDEAPCAWQKNFLSIILVLHFIHLMSWRWLNNK